MENKENPPLARNLPPVSGKIAWSRQLYRRIAGPVEVFQTNQQLMQLPETKKAIKKFNRLARVLVEYELVFLQIWTKQIDAARVSLNATVLVRHPDTKELYVNFDKKVLELLRDIQALQGMGVEMPTQGLLVYGQKNAILERYDAIRVNTVFFCRYT
jgi:dynein heavy chain